MEFCWLDNPQQPGQRATARGEPLSPALSCQAGLACHHHLLGASPKATAPGVTLASKAHLGLPLPLR